MRFLVLPERSECGADCMSEVVGLYSCGKGADYLGGILSAADGLRCADVLMAEREEQA